MIGQESHICTDEQSEYKQLPIKHSLCVSLGRDIHWKCLILSLLIFGCLGAISWCRLAVITTTVDRYASEDIDRNNPCQDGYIYIPIAFVILLYLVYLVECWHCHTRIELKHKVDVPTVYHKMRQMREALPVLWWKAVCYHYVRKTRQITRYRNGDAFTTTQIYYERVNSHTAGCAFNFSHCGFRDISKFVTGLEDHSATKIRFSKRFSFIHANAKYEFDAQRNQFFGDNERRDDYMETREGMDLLNVNFKDYMMTVRDPDKLPWYVLNVTFWIASFLLLSWPLRVIIEYKTAYIHYHVHKIFGTNYVNTFSTSGNVMTRMNTIGSTELDMIVRNNLTIVPSYSEALLMNVNSNGTSLHMLHDANTNVTSPFLGPTRSFTWNDISLDCSSGPLSNFLSGSNTHENIVHSASFGSTPSREQFDNQTNNVRTDVLSSSLRNIFLPSWHKKWKHYRSINSHSNVMFTSVNRNSHDVGNSFTSHGDEMQLQQAFLPMIMLSEQNSRISNIGLKLDISGSRAQSACECFSPLQATEEVNTQIRANAGNEKGVRYTSAISLRPNAILNGNVLSDSNHWQQQRSSVAMTSKLPKVAITNVLSESASSVNTLPSPPGYEEALKMNIPNSLQLNARRTYTENSRLLSERRPSPELDRAVMETSL